MISYPCQQEKSHTKLFYWSHQPKFIPVAIIASIFVCPALAQNTPIPDNPSQGENITGPTNPLDRYQFYLTCILIAFAFFVIVAQLLMLRRIPNLTGDDVAKNCAITTVILSSLVLIIAGYSSGQIAPAFGLFGTIVGYLLGRTGRAQNETQTTTQKVE
jgi:hypothetical protein